MRICVKTPTGKRIYLNVRPSDTLSTVKTKIQEQYRLVFNGVMLDDNHTLADYDIQHTPMLELQEKRMLLSVVETPRGRVSHILVDRLDTIGSVKAKIESDDGFPKNRQTLMFAGKQLEDNRTLSDLDVIWTENSALQLVLHQFPRGSMRIFVKMFDVKKYTLEADSLDTVGDVKLKIYQKDGTWPRQQRLIFAGKQLQDDLTLADWHSE